MVPAKGWMRRGRSPLGTAAGPGRCREVWWHGAQAVTLQNPVNTAVLLGLVEETEAWEGCGCFPGGSESPLWRQGLLSPVLPTPPTSLAHCYSRLGPWPLSPETP